VIVRQKDTYDGAQPSGNALVCMSLYYLGHVFDKVNWISQSEHMIHQMRKLIIQYPSAYSYWGQCFSWMADDSIELVAIGPKVHNSLIKVLSRFQPHKMLIFSTKEDPRLASTNGKYSVDNQYYICVNKTCLPANDDLNDILALC
jgi:uncharacterized protein YyaL (SSP411 family)